AHCENVGRDPGTIRRSMMTFGVIGPQSLIDKGTERLMSMYAPGQNMAPDEFRKNLAAGGAIVGGTDQIVDTLGKLAEHGIQEIQFQHFFFDNDEIPEYLASDIAPQVASL
ncbi:MAG TPA: hypothetical protein QGF05_12855, partial [Dehalococcoidia bacterium]|nr:hypothetical protein [Dehalococcoidia bacterium]